MEEETLLCFRNSAPGFYILLLGSGCRYVDNAVQSRVQIGGGLSEHSERIMCCHHDLFKILAWNPVHFCGLVKYTIVTALTIPRVSFLVYIFSKQNFEPLLFHVSGSLG